MATEFTPEQQAEIDAIRKALQEEFAASDSGTRANALTDIQELKEDFLETLKHVCKHSQSDALRAKVAMWGYDRLLERDKATADPLADLVKEIAARGTANPA